MTHRPILTQAAADILELTRTQINEARATGVYDGFPEVVDGNRYWNRDHLMFGKVFGTFLKAGLQPLSAAKLAGAFLGLLRKRDAQEGYWFQNLTAQQKRADIKLLISDQGTVQADFAGDRHELEAPRGETWLMRLHVDVAALSAWADEAIENHNRGLAGGAASTGNARAKGKK